MPALLSREKVLVQYRLLKDFDELRRQGIPGIDIRVMEDNIYEWHVTMSPLSGHYSGLRIHMVLLMPDDYPRRPPKVELYNYLPHSNVFLDFLQAQSQSWSSYWQGSSPSRGRYVLCTDLLEERPPPLDPNDSCRHEGWSPSYSVEAVLVQLQCLLFDDYVHADTDQHINTLWDKWYASAGEGRLSRGAVCANLHRAQREADNFCCKACGYCGLDDKVAFWDKPETHSGSSDGEDEEASSEDGKEEDRVGAGDEGAAAGDAGAVAEPDAKRNPEKRKPEFVSRKKQRKQELAKLKIDNGVNTKVNFNKQRLYMEISNSNSALVSGKALRRVPGVFKERDVVSFHFQGVEDGAYLNGYQKLNVDLQILNYGHEVQFPWRSWDAVGKRWLYSKEKLKFQEEKEPTNKGKASWEQFVNSQGGGGKLKAEDTPGTEAFVKKREKFFATGVVESVDASSCTVHIVVAGEDGKLGATCGKLTEKKCQWSYLSESSGGRKAVLYKNVPMEKVTMHGCEGLVVPYDHPPPVKYKPMLGHYGKDEVKAYDVTKDAPVDLIALLEGGGSAGLTRQRLDALPSALPAQTQPSSLPECSSSAGSGFELVEGESFEVVSCADGGSCAASSWEMVSQAASSGNVGSFDVVSVVSSVGGSLSHSFHVVPSSLGSRLSSAISESGAAPFAPAGSSAAASRSAGSASSSAGASFEVISSGAARSRAGSAAESVASEHSLLSLRSSLPTGSWPADAGGSWRLLLVLSRLNVPVRGVVRSTQAFGTFVSVDATPRNLAVRNRRLLPSAAGDRAKGKGKGKGKGDREPVLQDGLLPCLPYMRSCWPPAPGGARRSDASVMVNGNVFDQLGRESDDLLGPPEVTVYVSEVDVAQKRVRLSLQPRLSFEELRVGSKHEGIVVDNISAGLLVALSDRLVGLLPRAQLGAGAFAEGPNSDGWYQRSSYRVGDRVTVWVLRKALNSDPASRRPHKIDLTMDKYTEELRELFFKKSLQVLDKGACGRQAGEEPDSANGKTAMDLQLQSTYDEEDRFFLIKNNRLIRDAESEYPSMVIDYQTEPPPPPPEKEKAERFDFSLIDGWSVQRIAEQYQDLSDREAASQRPADAGGATAKPTRTLNSQEKLLLTVLRKKVEQWGKEYYERVSKKVEERQKYIQDIHRKIQEERDKYPYKSVISLDKFRELSERIKEKGYDRRCCFATRLSFKEDVLGVGLEIVDEADTGRKVFRCSFDLLSKEAFKDFGIRSGVWKEKVEFWLPIAIDASHFRRALPHLAECFRQLGDGRVEKQTRSYGTQAGSAKYNLRAQLREVERSGKKIISFDEYRRQQAERKNRSAAPSPEPSEAPSDEAPVNLKPVAGLTEADVAYGLEVLPKLMNLQTVQLMKGDLHLSTKALEGYMGFHHLLLSILRQYPSLQAKVETKIGAFVRSEEARTKKGCPNIGEFLCLLAVSKKYTWDDVSAAVLKETLDRNASWALDKFPSLRDYGTSVENRLERTFKASVVSIRLLCFNVWFLRNIVFKKYGPEATSADIINAERQGGPVRSLMDLRWEEYEEQKGIPKPSEVDLLQEQVRRTLHGEGLNSWAEYLASLNLKPLPADELSQLLVMSLHDAVRKGYIPLWKLRPKLVVEKSSADDVMDKYAKYDQ